MNLTDTPCEQCRENCGWVSFETPDGYMKSRRCDCDYAQKLQGHHETKNHYQSPRISTEHATICAEMMATIPYFPGEPGARIAIADEIASMAADEMQAVWIARRMIRLYSKWPGLAEMRRVFWRNHKSLDGVEPIDTYSEAYPQGIPLENQNLVCIAPGITQPKRPPKPILPLPQNEHAEPFVDLLEMFPKLRGLKAEMKRQSIPTQSEIDEIKAHQERNRKQSGV